MRITLWKKNARILKPEHALLNVTKNWRRKRLKYKKVKQKLDALWREFRMSGCEFKSRQLYGDIEYYEHKLKVMEEAR